MKTIRIALASLTTAAALMSCSGTPVAPGPAPAATGTATSAAPGSDTPSVATTADEAAVESTFLDYYQALVARDFVKACSHKAPESKTKLIDSVRSGGQTVGTCEEAFTAIYAIPGSGERADRIGKTTKVEAVTVKDDAASVKWSIEAGGKQQIVNTGLRRLDGQWLLLDATT